MANPATLRRFQVELSDIDHGVYETMSFQVAQHPSESPGYLVSRVLAFLLNQHRGVSFSKTGLCDGDEPPVEGVDDMGNRQLWIDVGLPSPERLHRAAKAASEVMIYVHKNPEPWRTRCASAKIYRKLDIRVLVMDQRLIESIGDRLARQNSWMVIAQDGGAVIVIDGDSFDVLLSPILFD